MAMKAARILALCLLLGGGCRGRQEESALFPGRWSYAVDVDEYAGLYIFDFAEDGKLYLEDYPAGSDEAYSPERRIAGQYTLLPDSKIAISDTNGEDRVVYRIDSGTRSLVYSGGPKANDIKLVRVKERVDLYRQRPKSP